MLCQLQPLAHKGQPFAVTKGVLSVHKAVVIDEILVAGVVRRIYVPADFDTNRKSPLRRRSAEKGLK